MALRIYITNPGVQHPKAQTTPGRPPHPRVLRNRCSLTGGAFLWSGEELEVRRASAPFAVQSTWCISKAGL
jgi:hypothetical protein